MRTTALLLLALATGAAADPTYEQIARAPSAYHEERSIRFTMRFGGLQDVDDAFGAIGVDPTTHVMVRTPSVAGAAPLPVFLSKKKSSYLKKLRQMPIGTTLSFRGRIGYFKEKEPEPASSSNSYTLRVSPVEGKSNTYTWDWVPTSSQASGRSEGRTHWLLVLSDVREIPEGERPPDAARPEPPSPARPAPPGGYEEVTVRDLTGRADGLAGRPIRFSTTYRGRLGRLADLPGGDARTAGPNAFAGHVGERNLDAEASELEAIALPGPLGRFVSIAFGADWEVGEALADLDEGDPIVVEGVLYPGSGEQGASRYLFVLEGVAKGEGGSTGRPGRRRR